MNRTLSKQELNHVFEHIQLVMDIDFFRKEIAYGEIKDSSIEFFASNKNLEVKEVEGVPILFASDEDKIYSVTNDGYLIFYHDLLKSAFYLLSGYDEQFVNKGRDHWNRVTYEGSIQQRMGIMNRPLVNEYFDLILKGINEYLAFHKKPVLVKRKLFDSFGFLLSHDIDVIDKYGWPHLGYKIKELFGLVRSEHSFVKLLKATFVSAFQFINPWRSNPYWNFDDLMMLEKKCHIKASYYFLAFDEKGGSRYRFQEKRLVNLFAQLSNANHEIGIHGTTDTSTDSDQLKKEIAELEESSNIKVVGGRQHRLWLEGTKTFGIHQAAGLKYDSSFGFAEHEGFRNSFCLPLKPYDFERKEAIDCWQFPLMAMDVTLFSYRKLSPKQIKSSIQSIIAEVEKHNGIFTLLWHNSFFDETLYPGVRQTYEELLQLMDDHRATGITGKELVSKLEENQP